VKPFFKNDLEIELAPSLREEIPHWLAELKSKSLIKSEEEPQVDGHVLRISSLEVANLLEFATSSYQNKLQLYRLKDSTKKAIQQALDKSSSARMKNHYTRTLELVTESDLG